MEENKGYQSNYAAYNAVSHDFHKRYINFAASDANGTINGQNKTSLTVSKWGTFNKSEALFFLTNLKLQDMEIKML